jgi:hypothetical protein
LLVTETPPISVDYNEMGGACSTYGREERVLLGKPEEKRPLGRPRLRWEDNIKMDIQKVGWGELD